MSAGAMTPRNKRILTAPAAEPVTLAQARLWCRIDDDITAEDALLELVIAAARERAEFLTGRVFVERTAELRLDDLPLDGAPIALPYAPLQYVTYFRYQDSAGNVFDIAGSPDQFATDAGGTPGRLAPLAGGSWPSTNGMPGNVQIGFRCGYAPGSGSPTDYAANLPALVKLWLQQRVATYYAQREALDLSNVKDLPRDFVDGLLDGLRVDFGFA